MLLYETNLILLLKVIKKSLEVLKMVLVTLNSCKQKRYFYFKTKGQIVY